MSIFKASKRRNSEYHDEYVTTTLHAVLALPYTKLCPSHTFKVIGLRYKQQTTFIIIPILWLWKERLGTEWISCVHHVFFFFFNFAVSISSAWVCNQRFGYKIDFSPPKESWLSNPFYLCTYLSQLITIWVQNCFFVCERVGCQTPSYLCTYLSQLIKVWVQTWFLPERFGCQIPFLLMHITISQVINIWVQTWFSLEKGRLSNPFLTYSQINHNHH